MTYQSDFIKRNSMKREGEFMFISDFWQSWVGGNRRATVFADHCKRTRGSLLALLSRLISVLLTLILSHRQNGLFWKHISNGFYSQFNLRFLFLVEPKLHNGPDAFEYPRQVKNHQLLDQVWICFSAQEHKMFTVLNAALRKAWSLKIENNCKLAIRFGSLQ